MKNPSETKFTLPVSNLHGTGSESLLNDYEKAEYKLKEAIEALLKVEFHARDYEDFESFLMAKVERRQQFDKMQSVLDYIVNHCEHLM